MQCQGLFRLHKQTPKLQVLHATPLRKESYDRGMWSKWTVKVYDSIKPHLFDDPDNFFSRKRLWYLSGEITIEDDWSSRDRSKHLDLLGDSASYNALSLLHR